jgi:Mg2+-importing ATPase
MNICCLGESCKEDDNMPGNYRNNGGNEGEGLSAPSISIDEILLLPTDEILQRLGTSMNGLSPSEVDRRLNIYGYNELEVRKKRRIVIEFLSHFKNPLVIILLFATLISGLTGEMSSAIIIVFIILMSTTLDFYQEHKAEKAAEKLRERVAITATVIRNGVKSEVKTSELVPGDIILLSAGDIVPADARIISAKDLFVDQSALTGESYPVEKNGEPLKTYSPDIIDWSNYLFMGTSIVSGSATAVVVRTGTSTEYGKIARELTLKGREVEFERGVRYFGYMIMELTFLLTIFVFFINAFYKRDVVESLLFAVSLAVGLTPELLPMIISINLSKGAILMSKHGVIVKKLVSIQDFGSMDILCTDKTGTLTENKVKLILYINIDGEDDEKVLLYSYLNSYYQTGLKSPLDNAILSYREIDAKGYRKIDEIPFDSIRKRLSIILENNGRILMITKGAPEEIMKICTKYEIKNSIMEMTDEVRGRIEQKYLELSERGFRVLGVAYKQIDEKKAYSAEDEREMIFLGFIAFIDPPKETARESIKLLKEAGIEIKILTGDNELVTKNVCRYLGLEIKGVVTGREIAQMSDEALSRVVEEANLFCRLTPVQKERIIKALRDNGHVVGFLGDGINDAPPIKAADVGISVDNAVDVAKEAADIILLKNDLTVLYRGVMEGRKTFGNTMKYIMMGISSNFGNMLSVAIGSIFLPFLPMLPIQILLNNLLYDISQTALPTDNVDPEYIEKPKRWSMKFIRAFMLYLGPVSSLFDFITFFTMLFIFKASEALFQTAWFMESLTSQTLVIFSIRTKRPFWKSNPSRYLLINNLAIVALALILPLTPIGGYFKFVQPPPQFYMALALILLTYISLAEAIKRVFYKRYDKYLEQFQYRRRIAKIYYENIQKVTQNLIATICLHEEREIPINTLIEELEDELGEQVDPKQVYRALRHLKNEELISVSWVEGKVKREDKMKEYVNKIVKRRLNEVAVNWKTAREVLMKRYSKINQEYMDIIKQLSKIEHK